MSGNVEEEYLWSVTLNGTNPEYTWDPKEPGSKDEVDDEDLDPSVQPNHRLLVKSAILHPSAKKDEVTMLEVTTQGYQGDKVVAPFLAMRGGKDLQQYVDLLLPDAFKIKIISGEGPVTLVGSHCVDFYNYNSFGDDEDEEEDAESSEDEAADMEEQETTEPVTKELKTKKGKEEEKEEPKKEEPKKEEPKKEEPKKEEPKKEEKKTQNKEGKKRKVSEEVEEAKEEGGKKRKKSGDVEGKKKRKSTGEKK